MALNFGQILNAVLTDGLDESRRTDAQEWVRYRHAALWDYADWTFKYKTAPITFTNGAQALNSGDYPSDMHAIYSMYDAFGEPLRAYRDVRQFFDRYNTLALPASSVAPEAYTTVAGVPYIGPVGNGSSGIVVYQMEKPSLANDSDSTGLPDGFDLALVYGAKATGFEFTNVPLASQFEQGYLTAIAAMENAWLDQTLETGEQSGAYRPGSGLAPWW